MVKKDFYALSATECMNVLGVSRRGLTDKEASARLIKNGENKLKEAKKKNGFFVFLSQFSDIMIIILLIASAISIAISILNQSYNELFDGVIILGIVFLNAIIGFVQEKKAENSMEALKKLTEPEAKVIRGGELQKIHSAHLVIGDIILLEAGDIVPADCRFIETVQTKCDESSLTGESEAVEKNGQSVLSQNTILAERKNMGYSGSIIVSGRATAVVIATAINTEIGKIASLITSSKKDETPLQNGIKQIGKIITYLILAICAVTFVIEVVANPASPLEAFLTAVAIAVAAIPESLPAVITIIMSLGIAKLAKRKAIVKHLHAVETLGSCEVICTDKTGTLTQNKMEVQTLFCGNKLFEKNSAYLNKTEEFNEMINCMLLCESAEKTAKGYMGDPTEIALVEFAESASGLNRAELEKEYLHIGDIPFDSNRKLMTAVRSSGHNVEVLTKGALDEVLSICTRIEIGGKILPLLPYHREKIQMANKQMATNALRVLAFAYKSLDKNFMDSEFESNLIFLGLAGMFDPPRKEVKKAVEKCKKAGILPVMITGDHKNTALAIARKVGIASEISQVITGAEIDKMTDAQFEQIIKTKLVFARVSPENKVRIVDAFKRTGKVVAMTGDGVNDAPSIKNASIGVGMGIAGTDVTKEVADVIITDDNFATIIIAVEEGRKIYTNIQKTVQFLFSANLAEITAIFLATIFMPEVVFLTPVQILFVNLITDTLPAIALGLEPAERNIMEKKPRVQKTTLLSNGVGKNILIIGFFQGIVMLSCFMFGYFALQSGIIATTMAFYALNIVQFFYFISMRTSGAIIKNPLSQNLFAVLAVLSCFAFVFIVAFTPLCTLLGLTALPFSAWLFITIACLLTLVASELLKLTYKRYK